MSDTFAIPQNAFPMLNKSSSIVVNQTYSWISNAGFYATVNPTYHSFYHNNVRRLAYWLDGYVPGFHQEQNGIFSTRMGNALVNSLGDAIFGRELLFRNAGQQADKQLANDSIVRAGVWSKASDFQVEAKKAIKYAQGLGTALIKLNKSKVDLWVEAVRLDYFYFEINARGDLQEVTCFLKAYTDASKAAEKDNVNYYLVEKRYFEYAKEIRIARNKLNQLVPDDPRVIKKPKAVYQVHKFVGDALKNQTYDSSLRETVRWDSIPKRVRDVITKDYGVIKIGEPQDLPFKEHLGAYLVTADEGNISLPQLPFGTSVLENIVGYLMGYDISYSYFFRDMYQGKGTVLVPKYMQPGGMGGKFSSERDPFSNLDQAMFTTYETTTQEKQVIEKIQFNLRSLEWTQIRDYIIENIAMTLQISPRTIASFLSSGAIKTATQVESEDTSSISFVETRRAVAEKPLNKLLKDVGAFYGWQDLIEIRFSKEGVINTEQLLRRVAMLLQLGLIDQFSALKEVMYDADEQQVQERYEKIKQDEQEKLQAQFAIDQSQQLM